VTTTIPVGLWPLSVTISPNGKYAYVTHDISVADYISVVSTSTNKETENITVGGNDTEYVAFTPNSEYAYVTVLPAPPNTPGPGPLGNGSVSIINTATNKMASSLPLLGEPIGLAISPNGTYAYVTTMKNGQNGAVLEISIPAAEQTVTTQNPAVPELSWLMVVPLLLSVFSVALIVRYRKSNCSKR
jgi:YVTN family beta-propeller protein